MDYRELVYPKDKLREQLTRIMFAKRFSFKELAADIGMPTGTLFYFLKGTSNPLVKTLGKIDDYLKKQTKISAS